MSPVTAAALKCVDGPHWVWGWSADVFCAGGAPTMACSLLMSETTGRKDDAFDREAKVKTFLGGVGFVTTPWWLMRFVGRMLQSKTIPTHLAQYV